MAVARGSWEISAASLPYKETESPRGIRDDDAAAAAAEKVVAGPTTRGGRFVVDGEIYIYPRPCAVDIVAASQTYSTDVVAERKNLSTQSR